MPKCRYCKEHFYAEIAIGIHLMTRRANKGKCPTPEEMKANGYVLYQGAWLTSEPQWKGTVGQEPTTAIQRYNGRGDFGYDYYHSEACQPETMIKGSGMQQEIPLTLLSEDCTCAGCDGNIHKPPQHNPWAELDEDYSVYP